MTDYTNLDDYVAALPADRQQTINDKAKVLSRSIELDKLGQIDNCKQSKLDRTILSNG